MAKVASSRGRVYADIVARLFLDRWQEGMRAVEFHRSDIETVAAQLGVQLPKNLGDLIYSFAFDAPCRHRS